MEEKFTMSDSLKAKLRDEIEVLTGDIVVLTKSKNNSSLSVEQQNYICTQIAEKEHRIKDAQSAIDNMWTNALYLDM